MAGKTAVVFITANVGSIFEEPSVMLKMWTQEFLSTISRLDPKFVALHCQEVGGKNYEKSMQYVEDFVQLLVNSDELRLFDKARIYLDEDYSSAENFTKKRAPENPGALDFSCDGGTDRKHHIYQVAREMSCTFPSTEILKALGNFYFIHESVTDALIYDFEERRFVEVEGKAIYSKNIENVRTKEKSKFPLEYFPECKWSRKGFLRTRWCLNGTIFDLVNIHLFHDVSNFVAIKSFPSVYSDTRRRALAYTLERFQTDEYGPVPLFLFGDFNFRTDTQGVVKHLSKGLNSSTPEDEVSIIQFKQEDKVILSLGKKEFCHSDHQAIFTSKDGDWLREFDKELDAFSDQLFEFEIAFPPSYPFEENSSGDRCYMKTRCPAWCDRVVLSHSAIPLVRDASSPEKVVYSLMGRNTCMGDHKPVYLKFDIKSDAAKDKWPESPPKTDLHGKMTNGLLPKFDREDKRDSDKTLKTGLKYSDLEIEKLACSLEALMSQNSSFSREIESNIEPDLSRCASCRIHQHVGRVINNPGGEEVSRDNLIFEDKKILALLASEIKVPEDILQKIEIQDTGQKEPEKETCSWDLKDEKSDRFGIVKRVNSASLVEHPPKKEDWKNSRCNSDVSWSATSSVQTQLGKSWKGSKQFNRGNSRIRLISSSNSLNASLPRLTSHHSSSDEEWFEEIEEGDDDVLRMNEGNTNLEKPVQIYPDDCGDKGAVAKCSKPVTESMSRTNIFLGETCVQNINNRILKEIPSESISCILADSPGSEDMNFLGGKSCDNVLNSQMIPKASSSQLDRESRKTGPKPANKSKPLSILRRLTEGRKECINQESQNQTLASSSNRESFETLIVDPTENEKTGSSLVEKDEQESKAVEDQKDLNSQIGDVKLEEEKKDVAVPVSTDSWETIELSGKKSRDVEKDESNDYNKNQLRTEKCAEGDGTNCCCILQ